MSLNLRFCVIAALIYLCVLAVPAQAGQLFPPANIGSNPNVSCPNGQVLTWTGETVACTNPTPGVSVSCIAGQVLMGISNGTPVCTTVPVCQANQLLNFNGTSFTCTVGGEASGITGWVSIGGCADGSPNIYNWSNGLNTCYNMPSPQQICENAGYANYTGACQSIFTDYNGTDAVQGTLISNASFDQQSSDAWGISCQLGSQTNQASARNLQVLCSR
jgi:hypothetical protein